MFLEQFCRKYFSKVFPDAFTVAGKNYGNRSSEPVRPKTKYVAELFQIGNGPISGIRQNILPMLAANHSWKGLPVF